MKKLILLVAVSLLGSMLLAKDFDIDKVHSNVGFKIKHFGINNVNGNFRDYDGLIDFDENSKTFKSIKATIKVDSINTDNEMRDNHLKSDDFFKANKYPEITFVMKSYQKSSDSEGKINGTLTIAGVSKNITLDAEIGGLINIEGKQKLGFSLSGTIKRSEFNFAPNTSSVILGDEIKLQIEIESTEL